MERIRATYQDRFILFIDLLGTKIIVGKTVEDNDLLDKISGVLMYVKNSLIRLVEDYSSDDNYKVDCYTTHFSDSYVLSIKIDEDQLLKISSAWLFSIQTIVMEFMRIGILVRGGVTYGKLIHNENILFGPAMVEAYDLENKMAVYPRVIFSHKIVELFQKNFPRPSIIQSFLNKKKDDDSYYYFDYIDADFILEPDRKIDYMISIIDCLDSNDRSTESLILKYDWLKSKILVYNNNFDLNDFILSTKIDSERRFIYSEQTKDTIIDLANEYVKKIDHLRQE